jgi:ankyrin repeat protein
MANTDIDAVNAAVPEEVSSRKRKKRIATAIVLGVAAILLGVAAWVFLFPHSNVPPRPNPDLLPLSELDEGLLLAVRNNDVGEVSRLLRAGANIDVRGNSGANAMKAAIALNRVDAVRLFLETYGESPFIREDNSSLIYAVVQNKTEIVREFLKLGLAVDRVDKNGYTALMYAIDRNHAAIARELLKAGADPNRTDGYGQTPLMQAATVGRPDVIALLLEAGANAGTVSLNGETAMSIAQRKNRNVVISLLVNAGSPLFY